MDEARPSAQLLERARAAGLRAEAGRAGSERLSGGVSCDIYRVETASGTVCVKQALEKLRVAADWRAPVERSHAEVEWLRLAERLGGRWRRACWPNRPGDHLFVMSYLPPEAYPNWKAELMAGRIDPAFAAAVGRDLAFVHGKTADAAAVARDFGHGAMFSNT